MSKTRTPTLIPAEPGIRQEEQSDAAGRLYAEALIDTVREGLVVLREDFSVETANASFYRLFGTAEAETKDQAFFELGDGAWDIPELRELLEEILPQDKTVEDFEVSHDFAGLGKRTMVLNAQQLDSAERILLAIEDVSGQRQSERERARSEQLRSGVTANLPNGGVFVVDHDLRYLLAEGQALVQAGLTPADLEGKSIFEALEPELVDVYAPTYRQALAGEPFRLEHPAHNRVYLTHGTPLKDETGEVYAALAVSYDITERKQAESSLADLNETLEQQVEQRTEALRRSQQRFAQAFHVGPVAAVISTLDEDRFLEVNESYLKLTGYARDEVVGKTAAELGMWSGPEDRSKLEATLAQGGGFHDLELKLRTKDGEVKDILASGEKINLDGHGGWLKMFFDITARKRSEEELMSAIQDVMADTAWFSQQVVQRLASVRGGERSELVVELTPRERQVLERIAAGMSDLDICEELNLKRQTVRNYVSNIYSKLGVHSRVEAAVWARERGIIA